MRGFTLLEIVIVLFIFSLLSGLVIPRLMTIYESVQMAYERDEVLAKLGSLAYTAYEQGKNFDLTVYPALTLTAESVEDSPYSSIILTEEPVPKPVINSIPLELPVGWQLITTAPIHFFANGFCDGGLIYLSYQENSFTVLLESPYCQPVLQ